MTLKEIFYEYDKEKNNLYHCQNNDTDARKYFFYDMKKKLERAFFCLGLTDLRVLKKENGEYDSFDESEKEYILHLLDMETSPLFKNLKKGEAGEVYLKKDNYKEYIKEIEMLREFIMNRAKNEDQFLEIIEGVYSKTQYPRLKFYYDEIRPFEENCLRSFVSKVDSPSIAYWDELYVDEQLFLLKKFLNLIKKWEEIVSEITEKRHDEIQEGIEKLPELETYSLVNVLETEKKLRREKELKNVEEKKKTLKRALEKRKLSKEEELTQEEKILLKKYDAIKEKKKSAIEKMREGNNTGKTVNELLKEVEELYKKNHNYVKTIFLTSVELENKIQQAILREKEIVCRENNLDFNKYLEEEKVLEQSRAELTSAVKLYKEKLKE